MFKVLILGNLQAMVTKAERGESSRPAALSRSPCASARIFRVGM